MDVPKNKLGLQGEEMLEVVDFKCDPILIGTLREEPGFFPAYHMSKDSWITVALDGSVSDDKTKMLLDMSYEATIPKTCKRDTDKFQFVASLWTASAVLYFCIALPYSFLSDGLVDISL